MYKIKKDDFVKIITGKDKGKEGKVLSVDTAKHRVIVQGCNMITKHQKAGKTPGAKENAIINREAAIHVSNVMLVADGKATRVGFKIENEQKVRVAKKTVISADQTTELKSHS